MRNVAAQLEAYAVDRQEVVVGRDPPRTHLKREPMAPKAFAALRAVLRRHRDHHGVCCECTMIRAVAFPCPTVRDITEALEGS